VGGAAAGRYAYNGCHDGVSKWGAGFGHAEGTLLHVQTPVSGHASALTASVEEGRYSGFVDASLFEAGVSANVGVLKLGVTLGLSARTGGGFHDGNVEISVLGTGFEVGSTACKISVFGSSIRLW
jgi:hypothetical protein